MGKELERMLAVLGMGQETVVQAAVGVALLGAGMRFSTLGRLRQDPGGG